MQQEIYDKGGYDILDIETKRQQIGIMYLYWEKQRKRESPIFSGSVCQCVCLIFSSMIGVASAIISHFISASCTLGINPINLIHLLFYLFHNAGLPTFSGAPNSLL